MITFLNDEYGRLLVARVVFLSCKINLPNKTDKKNFENLKNYWFSYVVGIKIIIN